MKHYCTYFDSNYLLRGLTMFRSLQEHAGDFTLWVLCCDDAAFEALQKLALPNLRAVRLSEIETFEPRLADAKANRTRVEYLWTLSPIWPLFLLENQPEIEMLTYLDADLFFFSSVTPIFKEIGANSVAMIAHRFAPRNQHMEGSGIYNVGWLSFRRDANGLACLAQWREQCLEWCYDYVEGDRYGDQKYLDKWPQEFAGVHVIGHAGAGVAPWNWQNHPIALRTNKLYVEETPLIFFHFHGLKFLTSWLYDACFAARLYGEIPAPIRRLLFQPYLAAMQQTAKWVRARGVAVSYGPMVWRSYMGAANRRLFVSKLLRRQLCVWPGLK